MSNDAKVQEYQQAVMTAQLCGQLLSRFDIPQLLNSIERADSIGPLLDPTLWRNKHKAMEEDRELLKAANTLRALVASRSGT